MLIEHGHPTTRLVLDAAVCQALRDLVRPRMPSETAGALLGRPGPAADGEGLTVEEAVPIRLVHGGMGEALDGREWAALQARLADAPAGGRQIVGWFYADPGIGHFPSRIDAAATQRTLGAEAAFFLLLNPRTDEAAFFRWTKSGFQPTGGFYEATAGDEPAAIPWSGELRGASAWLAPSPAPPAGGLATTHLSEAPAAAQPRPIPPPAGVRPRRLGLLGGLVALLLVAGALVAGALAARTPSAPAIAVPTSLPAGPSPALTLTAPAPTLPPATPTRSPALALASTPVASRPTASPVAPTASSVPASATPVPTAPPTPLPPTAAPTAPTPAGATPGLVVAPVPTLATPASAGSAVVLTAGDSLPAYARRHGLSLAAILAYNALTNPAEVGPGRPFRIPPAAFHPTEIRYQVRAGETLGNIAALFGVTPVAIARRNGLTHPDMILAGQMLAITVP